MSMGKKKFFEAVAAAFWASHREQFQKKGFRLEFK